MRLEPRPARASPRLKWRSSGASMEALFDAQGELKAFRTYQKQPAHREEPIEAQLRGFLWNRKHEYAVLIVEALDLDRIPRPLTRALAHALPASAP
jgi:hypothetical protein